MREVISVHVGQAGVQIGNACCERSFYFIYRVLTISHRYAPGELYTLEHGLSVCISILSSSPKVLKLQIVSHSLTVASNET